MRHNLYSDTWVATDALGRVLPTYSDVGAPRPGKYVGLFYFINRNNSGGDGPRNVTELKAANPIDTDWPAKRGSYYWGEPEIGYYRSDEEWALRRHAYMLADAGVDTLIFDTTNNQSYPDTYMTLAKVFAQIRKEGEPTPQFCFLASEESVYQIWDDLYSKGLYRDLWFEWRGKPLLIFGQWEKCGDMNTVGFPPEIQDFFSIRQSWAWDSLPWYRDGKDQWPWVAHHPQCIGWHDSPDHAEQVPVTIGQHPLSNIGRSFHNGAEPEIDEFDLTPCTDEGLCFAEQWEHALEVDPEFIFITGWNEWTAGCQVKQTDGDEEMAKWNFFPGAQFGVGGREIRKGDVYFIDQYNQEFSRDAEPMKGGHTDNYYYQMIDGIRRFKGVREPIRGTTTTIDIDGDFEQWSAVQPEYRDHLFETIPRDAVGTGLAGPYINTTGRNEFVRLKTTHDAEMVSFYVETREAITPASDPNWMMLFLNIDQRKDTGWEGYNILINWPVIDGDWTSVKRNTGGWSWENVGRARYRLEGNKLMIAVLRECIGLSSPTFDFHWVDNVQHPGEIEDFFVSGDSAPPRRFDYRYLGE